ncbi:type III PLP-dependent enzyme [Aliiruegeria sabulilitoris]|uniref:type III PLP-dependent enzyme n=1 Tax=Aliiruegeria sabulilitoris TaxID=1510458 RepID=UPI00082D2800|nr:type III PLP-dependent enzyme [Aliiruegeria sabulilitoris]NDR59363.1 type III PLP-dependent enzyme [Pseudoruegeria sp. M32A2M]
MGLNKTIWKNPGDYIAAHPSGGPVLFFAPAILQRTAARFRAGFPGLVSYAVKANPETAVLQNLSAAGIAAFDVASVEEIELLRRVVPEAVLHFNNPVRGQAEIAHAVALGVRSFSVDSQSELAKLAACLPVGSEVSVRFKLPVPGAAYDFGSKFGATAEQAAELLRAVASAGLVPSMTFHPGTQCIQAAAWESYIREAAVISKTADVRIARLNVGGGFPAHRLTQAPPDLEGIFERIGQAARTAFGPNRPDLLCEPGRGMVAESQSLAARVRAVRDASDVFLDDGVYGGLMEFPQIGTTDRYELYDSHGNKRRAPMRARTVFGPTCDSLDRLPGQLNLPETVSEGDVLLFHGMGAYSTATVTRFNGFGHLELATVQSLGNDVSR